MSLKNHNSTPWFVWYEWFTVTINNPWHLIILYIGLLCILPCVSKWRPALNWITICTSMSSCNFLKVPFGFGASFHLRTACRQHAWRVGILSRSVSKRPSGPHENCIPQTIHTSRLPWWCLRLRVALGLGKLCVLFVQSMNCFKILHRDPEKGITTHKWVRIISLS